MIIQQADKGGKIVLMDKDDYLNACQDMLEDTTFYQKEAEEKHLENIEKIRSTVNELEGLISDKERKYILEDTDRCRMPLFSTWNNVSWKTVVCLIFEMQTART